MISRSSAFVSCWKALMSSLSQLQVMAKASCSLYSLDYLRNMPNTGQRGSASPRIL